MEKIENFKISGFGFGVEGMNWTMKQKVNKMYFKITPVKRSFITSAIFTVD